MTKQDIHVIIIQFDAVCVCIGSRGYFNDFL